MNNPFKKTDVNESISILESKGISVKNSENDKYEVVTNQNTQILSESEVIELAKSYSTLYS